MNKSSILVLTSAQSELSQFNALRSVAAENDLHLSVLVLGRMPQLPVYATGMGDFGMVADTRDWQKDLDKARKVLENSADLLKNHFAALQVSSDVNILSADPMTFPDALARRALTCDLVVLSEDLRAHSDMFNDVVGAALFRAPIGLVLNGLSVEHPLQPRQVLVGWNSGVPASRAIRAAMPILRSASEVVIAVFDPVMTLFRDGENPGCDVARWLTHQGCTVSVQQLPSGGQEIAEALLLRAKESDADMVVMGAYDHSRMRQIVFGGTTRSMIKQTDIPVLLAH